MEVEEILTPELDKIPSIDWMGSSYSPVQEKEIGELIKNHIWITARREKIPVVRMGTSHIVNCIRCWEGKGNKRIPSNYLGGKKKWLKIFNDELIKRN